MATWAVRTRRAWTSRREGTVRIVRFGRENREVIERSERSRSRKTRYSALRRARRIDCRAYFHAFQIGKPLTKSLHFFCHVFPGSFVGLQLLLQPLSGYG